jgi:hypothetical protein
LRAEVPSGWDGEIYRRNDGGLAPFSLSARRPFYPPVLHLATFPLPAERGDFGGGALEAMAPLDLFISLMEHDAEAASSALFERDGVPWPLRADDFSPDAMRVPRAGQAGRQEFFRIGGRGFALYAVVGSHFLRRILVARVNAALAGIDLG